MGLRDTEEMLEACKADAAQLERDLARARAERDVQIVETKRLQRAVDEVRRICDDPRPWDEHDADSAEARSARAYNSALANVIAVIGRASDVEHDHGLHAHDQPA